MAEQFAFGSGTDGRANLAIHLGVSAESLARLQVGWSTTDRAWTFPMRAPSGDVVGIRLRGADGRKFAVRGGREGLFLPDGAVNTPPQKLFVAEGATDAAALLDLGFAAIGRPNCAGGASQVAEYVQQIRPGEIVLVADADEPGRRGAAALAAQLTAAGQPVRVIRPPEGLRDARDWVLRGASSSDIIETVEAASRTTIKIELRRRKNRNG